MISQLIGCFIHWFIPVWTILLAGLPCSMCRHGNWSSSISITLSLSVCSTNTYLSSSSYHVISFQWRATTQVKTLLPAWSWWFGKLRKMQRSKDDLCCLYPSFLSGRPPYMVVSEKHTSARLGVSEGEGRFSTLGTFHCGAHWCYYLLSSPSKQ